jgi:hypothetical protein
MYTQYDYWHLYTQLRCKFSSKQTPHSPPPNKLMMYKTTSCSQQAPKSNMSVICGFMSCHVSCHFNKVLVNASSHGVIGVLHFNKVLVNASSHGVIGVLRIVLRLLAVLVHVGVKCHVFVELNMGLDEAFIWPHILRICPTHGLTHHHKANFVVRLYILGSRSFASLSLGSRWTLHLV